VQKIYFVPIFTKPIITTSRIKYFKQDSNYGNLGWFFKLMKQLTFIYELAKFMLISVPLACCIYLTAHIYFEIKRLINDRNRQQY
jgi:hypothetical protein